MQKYFNAMQRFFVAAWNGDYQAQAEESSETYEFAQFIKQNRAGIRRARFYFITDREYTGRSDPEAIQIDQYKRKRNNSISAGNTTLGTYAGLWKRRIPPD